MACCLGVAEDASDRYRFNRIGLRLQQIAALIGLSLQRILSCDSQNVSVNFLGEPVVAQNDVQGLIPGHFVQNQRYTSPSRRDPGPRSTR